jgi:hypothetical protein
MGYTCPSCGSPALTEQPWTHDTCSNEGLAKKSPKGKPVGADPTGLTPTPLSQNESHREGVSFTKVNRGDRRWTFPNDQMGIRLLHVAIALTRPFAAEEQEALGSEQVS